MIVWLAALSTALAAPWTVAAPLGSVLGADGRVTQPAGVAFRLETAEPGLPDVHDAAGLVVELLPVEGGWLVPAPDRSRALSVVVAHPARVSFRRSDAPADTTAWMGWEVDTWRAIHHGGALPVPPTGSERTQAGIAIRAAAVEDRDVVWLGALADTVEDRPWTQVTHAPGLEAPLVGATAVDGPGLAILRLKLPEIGLQRVQIVPLRDGVTLPAVPAASTGAGILSVRVWVPPGRHAISARIDGAVPETLTLQPVPLRPSVARPVHAPDGLTGLDLAEWLWLSGERDAARTAFTPFVGDRGPRGELARARLLMMAMSPAEAESLAVPLEGTSRDGLELLTDAALTVAGLLSPETVLDRVRASRDPDLHAVARWLDQLGGTRPRGLALLREAAARNPSGSTFAAQAVREAGVTSRWSRLPADEGAITLPPVYSAVGPGVSRRRLDAGEQAAIELPVVPRGRFPILRLRSDGHVQWKLDGRALSAPGGALDFALPAGPHQVEVVQGTLIFLDPEVVTGGTKVWEWSLSALPATWTVPDAAWEGELRVDVVPATPVNIRVGAREIQLRPRTDGTYPPLAVHPGETTVAVSGPPGAGALVALRTLLSPDLDLRPAPIVDPEDGLARLRTLTGDIDAGDVWARERRAVVLAGLGQLTAARRDLSRLDPRTLDDAVRLSALWTDLAPQVQSAALPGPRSVQAALAWSGLPDPAPADVDAIEAIAARTDSSYLWSVVAELRLAAGDLVGATLAANRAADPERETLDTIENRTKWSAVTLPDRAAGIVPVTVERRKGSGFWRAARDAMLRSPWPEEDSVALRGQTHDVARFSGRTLLVEAFCRDEAAVGEPCEVPIRVGNRADTLRIADGRQDRRLYTLDGGRQELDLGGPGPGRAAVVRVTVDGVVLPPVRSRRALQATGSMPVEVSVAGPALVRVRSVRGAAQTPVGAVSAGETVIVPIVSGGVHTVRFTGNADLLVDIGAMDAPIVALPPPEAPEAPPPLLTDAQLQDAIWPFVKTLPAARIPGDDPTVRAQVSYHHEELRGANRTWDTVELSLAAARAWPVSWLWGEAWMRGAAPAVGAVVQTGRTWETGRAWLDGRLGYAVPVPGAGGRALSAQVQANVREELPVTASDTVRGQLRLRGGSFSEPADARVDLRAWTRWDADHPFFAEATLGWAGRRWTDLRLGLGARVMTNSFGDAVPVDAVGPYAEVDLLLGRAWVVQLDGTVRYRPADAHRLMRAWATDAELELRRGVWDKRSRWWEVSAAVGLVDLHPEVHVGLSVWFTDGRGLYDLPPGSVAFRTARELE